MHRLCRGLIDIVLFFDISTPEGYNSYQWSIHDNRLISLPFNLHLLQCAHIDIRREQDLELNSFSGHLTNRWPMDGVLSALVTLGGANRT